LIFGEVTSDLDKVEVALRWEMANDPAEVARPMADLIEAGGKRLRPALVLLSAQCGHYDLERLLPAAMAVEMTHAATLVHDDVIDRSSVRRGRPTVAASLGDEPAIVIGDFHFAKAYELAARTNSAKVVSILARAVMDICAGEVRQQSVRYIYSTDFDEYVQRIADKTAKLIGASCEIGGLLGRVTDARRVALLAYGQFLGVAFQIADDVLDYTGSEDEVGKPLGHDVAEGFATLPLILATDVVSQLQDGRRLSEDEARDVTNAVRASDGPRLALEQAKDFAQRAREQLRKLGECEPVSTLVALTDYVVTRKF
jgi:heptaprenyl diphosphate synthase